MDKGPEPKSNLLRIAAHFAALALERNLPSEKPKACGGGLQHVPGFLKRGRLTRHQSEDRRLLDRDANVGLTHRDDCLQGAFTLCNHSRPRFCAQFVEAA